MDTSLNYADQPDALVSGDYLQQLSTFKNDDAYAKQYNVFSQTSYGIIAHYVECDGCL